MDWLGSCGNRVARKRLADIHQMCSHLGIPVDWDGLTITPIPVTEVPSAGSVPVVAPPVCGASPQTHEVVPAWQPADPGQYLSLDVLSFSPGEVDIAGFWDEGGLSLDGTFETDWQEFERIASQF